MNIFSRIKNRLSKMFFRFRKAEYMRVAYLSPRQVVLITTRFGDKENVLPIDWHIPLSFSPKLYAISLESKNFSYDLIQKSKCFVVNFVSAELEKRIIESGRISGKETDKFETIGLEKIEAKKINSPVLKDSLGYLECKVIDTIITGDHTLFIGEVVHEEISEPNMQLYHITKDIK